jgi:hypothetical protein
MDSHGDHLIVYCPDVSGGGRGATMAAQFAILWGRRSFSVACLRAAHRQATKGDGLPHLPHGCIEKVARLFRDRP